MTLVQREEHTQHLIQASKTRTEDNRLATAAHTEDNRTVKATNLYTTNNNQEHSSGLTATT